MPFFNQDNFMIVNGKLTSKDIDMVSTATITNISILGLQGSRALLNSLYTALAHNDGIRNIRFQAKSIKNGLQTYASKKNIRFIEVINTKEVPFNLELQCVSDDSMAGCFELLKKNTLINLKLSYGDWDLTSEYKNGEQEISYFIFKRPVGTIYLRDEQFIKFISFPTHSPDKLLPQNFPIANLINQYFKLDAERFNRLAINYFTGPLIDDLDYRLSGIIIANYSLYFGNSYNKLFEESLFPVLGKEEIQYTLFELHAWLRDLLIPLGNDKLYVHGSFLQSKEQSLISRIAPLDPNNFSYRNMPKGYAGLVGGGSSTVYVDKPLLHEWIRAHCKQNNIEMTLGSNLIEGGNIFSAYFKGKIFVFLAKNLRISNAIKDFQDQASNSKDKQSVYEKDIREATEKFCAKTYSNKLKNTYYDNLEAAQLDIKPPHIKVARKNIERSLNIPRKQAVWVNNANFHLDIDMAQGEEGTILINNHNMVAKIAKLEYEKSHTPELKRILDVAELLHRELGNIIKANKAKIERYGFKVVEVPGVVYCRKTGSTNYAMIANFMNGFTGIGKKGRFHIALASRYPAFDKEFERILQKNNVDNVYLIGEPNSNEQLLTLYGSLRCLSTPGSRQFGNLAAQEGFPQSLEVQPSEVQPLVDLSSGRSNSDTESESIPSDDEIIAGIDSCSGLADDENSVSSEEFYDSDDSNNSINFNDRIPNIKFNEREVDYLLSQSLSALFSHPASPQIQQANSGIVVDPNNNNVSRP